MFTVITKIHDKFSVEFKVGFAGDGNEERSNFAINSWIFLPNSIGVNRNTYSKEMFHRDIRSNIRLITPNCRLDELLKQRHGVSPYERLCAAVEALEKESTQEIFAEYEFRLKLFAAIFKSSLRDAANRVVCHSDTDACCHAVEHSRKALKAFRALASRISDASSLEKFRFADEYMSQVLVVNFMRVLDALDSASCSAAKEMILEERRYRDAQSYGYVHPEKSADNHIVLRRHGLLKKYVESALFLKVDTHKDGQAVEQFWFGVAAGLAMVLSTLVALPFQHYWASYPTLIFIILVIAYMFKDRMKELMRGMFANQLKNRYFDRKTVMVLKDRTVGWVKESVDFVNDSHIPETVMRTRGRDTLESDVSLIDERILFYRKRVHVDHEALRQLYGDDFIGINDIMRVHLNHFLQQMDDPEVRMSTLEDDGSVVQVTVPRIYQLCFVMQISHEGTIEWKKFRITATRNGIVDLEEY